MSTQSKIDEILKKREAERAAAVPAEPDAAPEQQDDKFYSILLGEGLQEHFLELRFRDGSHTCFAYSELSWFNFNPDEGIDLDFAGNLVSIKGRGFMPKLFTGLKQKRVAWVKEADVELQDHKDNETFVEGIEILPTSMEVNEPAE